MQNIKLYEENVSNAPEVIMTRQLINDPENTNERHQNTQKFLIKCFLLIRKKYLA